VTKKASSKKSPDVFQLLRVRLHKRPRLGRDLRAISDKYRQGEIQCERQLDSLVSLLEQLCRGPEVTSLPERTLQTAFSTTKGIPGSTDDGGAS
jgi:hypothetical protein